MREMIRGVVGILGVVGMFAGLLLAFLAAGARRDPADQRVRREGKA